MEIIVIVEPIYGGYRARCRHPVIAEATGDTGYAARLALESILQGMISPPFTILVLEATPDKPWISTAGSIPDDAVTNEWLAAIEEYRRECDAADQMNLSQASASQHSP